MSRITVRLSESERADLERAASVAGVATGALVRVCAVKYAAIVAAAICEVRRDPEWRVSLRSRNR